MDAARWERVEAVFGSALDRPGEERAAFLDEACAGDAELRRTVEHMLAHHEQDPDFLERPVARVSGMAADQGEVPDAAGRYVGRYRLVRLLGRGGMGEVYLAVQEGDDFRRPVAIKVIRRGMDTDEVLRRFRLERRILATLAHPNIAALLDGGATEDGRPYFAMEYVEGTLLDEYVDKHALPVEARLSLFLSVCDAVQHAHQSLVLHRDLKPGNIVVTADGVPKLLDFGIGKLVGGGEGGQSTALTRTGLRPLTPEYASPEQVRGDAVTVASDVYGLGVLLYELLTGATPYGRGRSGPELERAILEEEPRRPSTLANRRRLSGDLDTIVLRALRKEPGRRYGSAAALAEDIRRHLSRRPILARPDTFWYRTGRFVQRNRTGLAASTVVLIALVGATLYSQAQSRRVAAERDRAVEVRNFLLEMFGGTSPDQATGDTVTARQLLDRQAARLGSAYADDPVLRGEMTAVLAEGYDRLGLFAQAEPLARAALDLQERTLGSRSTDVAASLDLLGWILHEEGHSREGGALIDSSVSTWRATGADPAGLSRALNDLGVVRDAAGDYDGADTLYTEALELRRARFGEGHRAVATTASNLSVIRYRKGDYAEAVRAASEALAAMRKAEGPDQQRSIIIQNNLAAMRVALGDYAGAEAEYRDLLAREERIQGPDHPTTLRVLSALATTLGDEGKWAEAEPLYRRALAAQERSLGPDHPQVAMTLTHLGQALVGLGRQADARPILERALGILHGTLGDNHQRTAVATESLAQAWAADDPGRAVSLHREAIRILDGALGADHPTTAEARLRLADQLEGMGRAAEAFALYDSAYDVLARRLPSSHPFVHRARLGMAQASWALGAYGRTDSLLLAEDSAFAGAAVTPRIRMLYDTLRARIHGRRSASGGS